MSDRADDERLIMNTLGSFARVLDSRDWQRVDDVFASDVTFDYGTGKEQRGVEAMRSQFARFLDVCGPSQHLIGSVMLTWDGDGAVTRAYVQARHQGAGDLSHVFYDANGEYIDRWERRPEGWRIVRRDVTWLLQSGDPIVIGVGGS